METKLEKNSALRIKYSFMVVNFVFFLIGWVFLGIGIWIALDNNDVSVVFEIVGQRSQMSAPIFVVMFSSASVSLVALLGFYGAHKEKTIMIIMYVVMSSVIFLAVIIGAIFALISRSQVDDRVRTVMRDTLHKEYGLDTFTTNTWNYAQISLYCCGAEDASWSIYRSSQWYHNQLGGEEDRVLVPPSCCTRTHHGDVFDLEQCQLYRAGPPYRQSGENRALNHRGCFDVARERNGRFGMAIAVTGFMLAICMIIGDLIAGLLIFQLKRVET